MNLKNIFFATIELLTMSIMSVLHVSGRKLPLAAGNTPINCSKGLNWMYKQTNKQIQDIYWQLFKCYV